MVEDALVVLFADASLEPPLEEEGIRTRFRISEVLFTMLVSHFKIIVEETGACRLVKFIARPWSGAKCIAVFLISVSIDDEYWFRDADLVRTYQFVSYRIHKSISYPSGKKGRRFISRLLYARKCRRFNGLNI